MGPEILTEFLEDAREHLEAAGQHLVRLEKDPGRDEDIHGLLRSIHSIKGNAGFLNLSGLYELLHKTENVLQIVREHKCGPAGCPPSLVDLLFQVLDTVEVMVGNLASGGTDRVDWLDRLDASLDQITETLDTGSNADMPPTGAGAAPSPAPSLPHPDVEPSFRKEPHAATHAVSGPKSTPIRNETPPDLRQRLIQRITQLKDHLSTTPDGPVSDLIEQLGDLQKDVDRLGHPPTRLAWNLIWEYGTQWATGSPIGPSQRYLAALLDNLAAWLSDTSACSGTASAGGEGLEVVSIQSGDLDVESMGLIERVRNREPAAPTGLVLDVRSFRTMTSSQIGMLMAALKNAPDPARVGLILDPSAQSGLLRVFRILGLDRSFRLFANPEEARRELG
jgi:HPt (histidine-containing phosphotransfer) domain-containing protein/anti-anti-sigma regulatory factor